MRPVSGFNDGQRKVIAFVGIPMYFRALRTVKLLNKSGLDLNFSRVVPLL